MRTTIDDVYRWLDRAKKTHTHMLVVCDTFSHEDYPVFVEENENAKDVYDKYHNHDMQRVMEVYDLSIDIEKQLKEHRAMHF